MNYIFRKKKILVTGSSGFIGSNLVPLLQKDKHMVVTWDKKIGRDIFDDLFEEQVVDSDIVIHLAALTSVDKSFNDNGETHRVNVLGTARVAELCVKYKKKLIFISSAGIYEPNSSPYALSKYLGDRIVWGLRKKIPVVILRLFNVYGKGMNKGSVMYNFLKGKIKIYGDGKQTRDFINVQDVCAIIEDSIKNKWNGSKVDVGTGESKDINYIAEIFAYIRNKKIFYDSPRQEIRESKARTQLLNKLYKENLTTNLEQDIKALCK